MRQKPREIARAVSVFAYSCIRQHAVNTKRVGNINRYNCTRGYDRKFVSRSKLPVYPVERFPKRVFAAPDVFCASLFVYTRTGISFTLGNGSCPRRVDRTREAERFVSIRARVQRFRRLCRIGHDRRGNSCGPIDRFLKGRFHACALRAGRY